MTTGEQQPATGGPARAVESPTDGGSWQAQAEYWQARAVAAESERDAALARAQRAEEVLSRMVLDDPWLFDRDGDGALECVFCQTIRGHMDGCPYEEARSLVAAQSRLVEAAHRD